jgi:hypothetical protein
MDWRFTMEEDRQQLYDLLYDIVGEAGCGVSCTEAEIYKEDGEWKFFLEGFMGPWSLGRTISDAKASLRDYAHQAYGLS